MYSPSVDTIATGSLAALVVIRGYSPSATAPGCRTSSGFARIVSDPPATMMSTPVSNPANWVSRSICWRWLSSTTLFAPSASTVLIAGCSTAASAGMSLLVGPITVVPVGDEIVCRIGVVAPTMPIFSPPCSATAKGAIFVPAGPAGASLYESVVRNAFEKLPDRDASPEKSRLALRYGNCTPGQRSDGGPLSPRRSARMLPPRTSLPRSNSWLPSADASKSMTFITE